MTKYGTKLPANLIHQVCVGGFIRFGIAPANISKRPLNCHQTWTQIVLNLDWCTDVPWHQFLLLLGKE